MCSRSIPFPRPLRACPDRRRRPGWARRPQPDEQDSNRPRDDPQIQEKVGFFDVLDVVLDPLLEVRAGAAGSHDLPEPGDARADTEARLAPAGAELVLGVRTGARADDGHVAY